MVGEGQDPEPPPSGLRLMGHKEPILEMSALGRTLSIMRVIVPTLDA